MDYSRINTFKNVSLEKSTSNYGTRTIFEIQLIISTGVYIVDKSICYIYYNAMFLPGQNLMATFLLGIKCFYIFTWGGEPSEVIHNSCFYIKRVNL